MQTVRFTRTFSAAHRLWNDESKCRNIHGHNYRVDVEITAGGDDRTAEGFIVPFDAIKSVIDEHDHAIILAADDPLLPALRECGLAEEKHLAIVTYVGQPTTEYLARVLAVGVASATRGALPSIPKIWVWLELRETDGIAATATEESIVY